MELTNMERQTIFKDGQLSGEAIYKQKVKDVLRTYNCRGNKEVMKVIQTLMVRLGVD